MAHQERVELMGREVKKDGKVYIVRLSDGRKVSGARSKVESAIARDK